MAKIVVVEDERHRLRVLEVNLRPAGYDPLCYHDPREALAQIQSVRPDLVILDSHMPHLNGSELHRALQANSGTRGIPVIFLYSKFARAEESPSEWDRIRASGCAYFVKPFDPREIVAKVRQMLEARSADLN
jgi:DNA-binding response OmpR family regulator